LIEARTGKGTSKKIPLFFRKTWSQWLWLTVSSFRSTPE